VQGVGNARIQTQSLSADLDSPAYPTTREDAASALEDVVLQYGDREERFVDVLDRAREDEFESRDDLETEVYTNLPTEAVGEPGGRRARGETRRLTAPTRKERTWNSATSAAR